MSFLEDINESNENPGLIKRFVNWFLKKYTDWDLYASTVVLMDEMVETDEKEILDLEKRIRAIEKLFEEQEDG